MNPLSFISDKVILYTMRIAPQLLLVERDPAVRALLVEGLKALKRFRVFEASSVRTAEQQLRNHQIDLVVLGFINEEMNGERSIWMRDIHHRVQGVVVLDDYSDLSDGEVPTSITLFPDETYTRCQRPRREDAIEHIAGRANQLIPRSSLKGRRFIRQRVDEEDEGTLTVLWVGPEHPINIELQRVCLELGLILVSVESAREALIESRLHRIEAAFVYHQLSDMPGISLIRSVRREVGVTLPIALVSPNQPVEERVEFVHSGVSLFLTEEVGYDVVKQGLRQLQSLGSVSAAKILVIDDDEALLSDLLSSQLSGSAYEVSCLTSPLRLLELLSEIHTDLLVIHTDMIGIGGFEVCRTLRATPEWQALPIILMGERDDPEIRMAAYRAGADDYLTRDANSEFIKTCLRSRLERSRVIQERADRDGLTGLLVRRAFNDALLSRMASARRTNSSVAICLIDLDHFKSINDTYGHIAGDRVLAAMGRLLSSSFRVEDLRGRWGGEEFVVAFSGEDPDNARAILERAKRDFTRFFFEGENDEEFKVTFSAGIACFPEHGDTIEAVFKVADERLYRVKECGRNRILAHDDFDLDELAEIKASQPPIKH